MNLQQLNEVKAAIAALQLEITAANDERRIAKERLEKAIGDSEIQILGRFGFITSLLGRV